jgi:hypothetical protein
MVPLRDKTTINLLSTFRQFLESATEHQSSLTCLAESTVFGQDDWEEDSEPTSIECWWGVFGVS